MKSILLLAAFCLLFSACGGGGSSGSGTTPDATVSKEITGTASEGAPLIGKAYLKDAKGTEIIADIGTNGTFKFIVDNMTAPYLLKAGTIYSFAPGHGTANINPFTDLATKIASNVTDLSTVYSNSTGTIGTQLLAMQTKIQSTVDDLNSKISQVYQKYGMTTSDQKNFMTGTVTIGQGVDALFDTFKITVASDGSITMKTISDGAIIFTAKSSGSGTMTIVSENFSANLPSSLAGSSTPTAPPSTSTGSITVKFDWGSSAKTTCKTVGSAPTGVATVRIIISGSDITTALQTDFAAANGTGTIDGILAGTERTLTAQGINSSGMLTHQGTATNITILPGQTTNVGTVTMIAAPTPEFTFTPATPVIGQTAAFTDTSTGSPTSWLWTFGDGSTSATQNPSHSYASAGTYSVVLQATNATGSNSTSHNIVVSPNTYAIAGKIAFGGAGLSGVTVTLTGGTTATTDTNGNYTFTGIQNGTYTLTPTLSGYSFTPTNSSATVSGANATGKNFTATNTGSVNITW
jgi:hypothetical protein